MSDTVHRSSSEWAFLALAIATPLVSAFTWISHDTLEPVPAPATVVAAAPDRGPSSSPYTQSPLQLLLDDKRPCKEKFGHLECLYCQTSGDRDGCLMDLHEVNTNNVLDAAFLFYLQDRGAVYQVLVLDNCLERFNEQPLQGYTPAEAERVKNSEAGRLCLSLVEEMDIETLFDRGRALELKSQ